MKLLAVFIGGGIGSLARYAFTFLIGSGILPWATLGSNFVSSMILGFLLHLFPENIKTGSPLYLFAAVGFCGGFSTFSTFSMENFILFKNANFNLLFLNIVMNVIVCFLGIAIGYKLSKWI